MNAARTRALIGLELTQRVRSVAWYVLLGVFAFILLLVTGFSFFAWSFAGSGAGSGIYSTVVYMVLLLVVFVSPTLSGNAINGEREAATLAPVQVTLATTAEILIAKVLAAWITGLAFLGVAVPFLIVATFAGGTTALTVVVSLIVLILEIGVITAIGVALSGILARPLFSVASTYLVVAALVFGTLIAFGLGGAAIRSESTNEYRMAIYDDAGSIDGCGEWEVSTYEMPRYDYVWWMLAPNPFVILADATPTTFDSYGNPVDLFGQIKYGVRSAQMAPPLESRYDECNPGANLEPDYPSAEEVMTSTVPSWFVGLALQVVLAGGLLWWAWARTQTPARRLPPGTRIA